MKFTVDTHLFRELGEYLVGRDSTALAELVKNSYDADATRVVIYGESLEDPDRGYIEIRDDGVGMTREEFEDGFLRIASRSRETGDRHSLRFRRRYTGAKGIGRLAAHKLARHLIVDSVPASGRSRGERVLIHAEIDWDSIEKGSSLDDVSTNGLSIALSPARQTVPPGTTIQLRRLRQKWTASKRAQFVSEVRGYRPAPLLLNPVAMESQRWLPLFAQPRIQEHSEDDPGFEIVLAGAFEQGDEAWQRAIGAMDWVLEIAVDEDKRELVYVVTPTQRKIRETPEAAQHKYSAQRPASFAGPFFQARIFVREGMGAPGRVDDRSGLYSGIRLYLEGFRVLPYGEPRNDWLGIEADYNDRSDRIKALQETAFKDLLGATSDLETFREGLSVARARHYLGGVFLTQAGAASLRMVVNREGFEPNAHFDTLVECLRTGIGLLTRVRAYYTQETRAERRVLRSEGKPARKPAHDESLSERAARTVLETRKGTEEAEKLARKGDRRAASERLVAAAEAVQTFVRTAADTLRDETGLVRVLASVGLQMGSFVHEVRSTRTQSALLHEGIESFRRSADLAEPARKEAAGLARMAQDLNRTLEWLARSLDEVSSIDKRRRRSRQPLTKAFTEAAAFVQGAADRRSIVLENRIPDSLQTCPMYAAELFAALLNVLSNAVKFAGRGGHVLADGGVTEAGRVQLRIQNTGSEVVLSDSEKLFRPFESTTSEIDAALGQGMGMGLPITRELLEEYGAEIHFVAPSEGYATAIEIVFPK